MKLERVYKSYYDNDCLGEKTFWDQFKNQINLNVFDHLLTRLYKHSQVTGWKTSLLEYFFNVICYPPRVQ
jgi:hypothetical protein